ncbi:hypothetical protein VB151_00810 [Xanthomonas fragariae]|uniref:hypothetical protein n=1 Tax=Xanthomonas fragariae TaxID=48664 RepID=UPI0003270338|nr:hypothetical protein [Xanthomonas fragariae]AOD16281.1 hypothetical protein BER92_18380 [Xanthomonas fragariae]AOD19710.1 hypothetical protein BER93_18430 [Xanthomonas fragariae]ENZ95556.1 hypothetical protein O1K_10687 [Xanthomonas fragariae LMG 25863]MBL9197048.1 hypothetical protein [Xanthomonas fragariae]MBL9221998.1 hypothetical protein [Xanthomonas fragariae]
MVIAVVLDISKINGASKRRLGQPEALFFGNVEAIKRNDVSNPLGIEAIWHASLPSFSFSAVSSG